MQLQLNLVKSLKKFSLLVLTLTVFRLIQSPPKLWATKGRPHGLG